MTILALTPAQPGSAGPAPFVDVLTCSRRGDALGYRLGGGLSGPGAVAGGDERLIDALVGRLQTLPTLGWMRGRLILLRAETLEHRRAEFLCGLTGCPDFDGSIFLPYRRAMHAASVEAGYWTVLRMAQSLGMISGRGVPALPRTA